MFALKRPSNSYGHTEMGLRLRVSSNKDRTRDPLYNANGLSTIVLSRMHSNEAILFFL